jgi:hypothetical protein
LIYTWATKLLLEMIYIRKFSQHDKTHILNWRTFY